MVLRSARVSPAKLQSLKDLVAMAVVWSLLVNTLGVLRGEAVAQLVPVQITQGQSYPGIAAHGAVVKVATFSDTTGHWASQSIFRMAVQGVIRGDGNGLFRPNDPLSREEAMALLVRAMGLEGQAQALVKPGGRWSDGYLEVATAQGLVTKEERPALEGGRRQPAQRQEVAVWVARALGMAPSYGTDRRLVDSFTDKHLMEPAYLGLLEMVVQEGIMVGVAPGLFDPRGPVTRAQAAAILDRINPRLLHRQGFVRVEGEILLPCLNQDSAGEYTVTYPVLLDDGKVINLTAQRGPDGTTRRDAVVVRAGTVGDSRLLVEGDRVVVLIQSDGSALLVEAAPSVVNQLFGTIVDLNIQKLTMHIDTGTTPITTFNIFPYTEVMVGGRPAALVDIQRGVEAAVTLRNGRVTAIRTAAMTNLPGVSPRDSRIYNGQVREAGPSWLLLVDGAGREVSFSLNPSTTITQGGSLRSWRDIKTGDQVRLFLSGPTLNEVERVEVAGPGARITGVVKGRIQRVNILQRQITLDDTSTYYFGEWLASEPLQVVDVDQAAAIYVGDLPAGWDWLATHGKGKEVLIPLSAPFGRPTGVKVAVLPGETRDDNRLAERVNWGRSELYLAGEVTPARFGPGTVVIRDGRLVDAMDLGVGQHAFVHLQREGTTTRAALVWQQEFLRSDVLLYRGTVERVNQADFRLNRFSSFTRNQWTAATGANQFVSFNVPWQGTYLDVTNTGRAITVTDFLQSRLTGKYNGFNAYVVVQGGEARGVALRTGETTLTKTAMGTVQQVRGTTLTVTGIRDWSEGYGKWIINRDPVTLDVSTALVWRDGRPGSLSDLKPGELIYLIHDHKEGFLIFLP